MIPDDFDGLARLFPLPNLVLFPGLVQGLHIFEPRYRQMTADALATDSRIALVMLQPDWEEEYDSRPAIESVACLGEIVAHELLPDGRYNLRLHGIARVRIIEEIATDQLYRTARVEVIAETAPSTSEELLRLRRLLAEAVLPQFEAEPATAQQLRQLFEGDMTLGQLCDVLAYALPLPPALKQAMLAEPDAAQRAIAIAEAVRLNGRRYPPDFSEN